MIGRSLLPFGDTFAVLMVVFLVLSLSVGRYSNGPQGTSAREPLLIAIGSRDAFGVQAEPLVAFTSNVDGVEYRYRPASQIAAPERVITFLRGVLVDPQILAQFEMGDVPSGRLAPIPDGTPSVSDYREKLNAELRGIGYWPSYFFIAEPSGTIRLPAQPGVAGELYALSDSCRRFRPIEQNADLKDAVNINTSGFGGGTHGASVSLTLSAGRQSDVTIAGIFSAPPPSADPEFIMERIGYTIAACSGFEGATQEELDDGLADVSLPCSSFISQLDASHQNYSNAEFQQLLRQVEFVPRHPIFLVTPSDPEDRRMLSELIYHLTIPKPVEIRVFEIDGSERLFRTPTWWEMFEANRGVAPNHAWTTGALCSANQSDFLAGDADDAAHLFSFGLTISRSGDIDHGGTLIEVQLETAP